MRRPCHRDCFKGGRTALSATFMHSLCSVALDAFRDPSGKARVSTVVLDFNVKHLKGGESCGRDPEMVRYASMLRAFLDGKPADLRKIPVYMEEFTECRRAVMMAARRIPRGRTVSYTELAAMSGHSRAVRAAASAMRNNPLPLIIPCHRVIAKNGTTGGFMGRRSGKAVELKRRLLRLEGVVM
jgi:O-6-methylguanine DNA methyltransferase